MPEYEARREDGQVTLYLTLFRSVGRLSRGDLVTRRGHAGPKILMPGAQCLREMVFEYSLIPHRGDWLDSRAYLRAREFTEPLLAIVLKGLRPCSRSFLRIEPEELVLTAFKMSEDGGSVVARFYNVGARPVRARVEPGFRYESAWLAALDERPLEKVSDGGPFTLEVGSHKIYTTVFELRSR